MPGTLNDRVTIYIWTSETNRRFPGHNVGHVAIETADEYMSLWPGTPFTEEQRAKYRNANRLSRKYQEFFNEKAPYFQTTFDEDCLAEGASSPDAAVNDRIHPQVTICLYYLDKNALEQQFRHMQSNTVAWRLIGRNIFVQNIEAGLNLVLPTTKRLESRAGRQNVDSCVSMAIQILKAGGIANAVQGTRYSTFVSKTSSAASPDDLVDLIIAAKRFELRHYSTTATYNFLGETARELLAEPKTCSIL